jgi:hypothetical protein
VEFEEFYGFDLQRAGCPVGLRSECLGEEVNSGGCE